MSLNKVDIFVDMNITRKLGAILGLLMYHVFKVPLHILPMFSIENKAR